MACGLLEMPSADMAMLGDRELQRMLLVGLRDKRFLLVLDDVWKPLWEEIKLMLPRETCNRSRIIVTTRNLEVASSIRDVVSYVHELHPLTDEEAKVLFYKKSFTMSGDPPEEVQSMTSRIVKGCGGLPLAIVTIGGMISTRESTEAEWISVVNDISKGIHKDSIQGVLLMSYKDLSFPLKNCFLYCAAFPQDYEIGTKRLIRMWMAEGLIHEEMGEGSFMEDVGERYLRELIGRCVLQVSKLSTSGRAKACRMHDLFHELCISMSEKKGFIKIWRDKNTRIDKNIHRISVQSSTWITGKPSWIRSLLVFDAGGFDNITLQHLKRFNLLRVLDLKDSGASELPSEVGSLMIHLRYINIYGTRISTLPASMDGLLKLQTLDIRRSHVKRLSFAIRNLKQLRCVEMGQIGISIQVPTGLSCLECLQVLTGLQATGSIIQEISQLTQLKKLDIELPKAIEGGYACSSISKMTTLSSLSITRMFDDGKNLDLDELKPPPSLLKLHLDGCMGKLPLWICDARKLTKLRLGSSKLADDPMPTLGLLPNLVFLQLYEAYHGKKMVCRKDSFIKLKIMILTDLKEWEDWEIEEGGMPGLNDLWIMSCSLLRMLPDGLVHLTAMNVLRLVSMPASFLQRLDCPKGEDYCRVKHVPTIQILD